MKKKLVPTPCDPAAAPGIDQVTQLTRELLTVKSENENLRRTCAALETTIRVQSKLIAI